MNKKILVTGGAGYIGSAAAQALIKQGESVVVFDDLSHGQQDKVPPQALFIQGDVTDTAALAKVFNEHEFSAVLHFAARKSVEESESEPTAYFRTNVTGTLNLLEQMVQHGVSKLVFSSSAAVYAPDATLTSFSEDATTAPINIYGQTKLMAEDIIKSYARTGQLPEYAILRYFNVAGDAGLSYVEQDAKNIFPLLVRALREEQTFKIFGTDYPTPDGTCVRDYIHLSDLVAAHVAALSRAGSGTYNLGTQNGYSVRQLIAAFEEVSGRRLTIEEAPRRAGDPAALLADASKAKEELGWQPEKTLKDMVESMLVTYN
ncbi:UDP-glucose 4-epimerase GalE [Candidatus Nomurabacteria bacterium]|nr:UDP-glucose 4-epimerase GalE [Candidatus Nomurabacteria bacterium]